MNISWLFGALVCFIIGMVLTITLIGAIIGIPLIVLSVIFLVIGLIMPSERKFKLRHKY